MTTAAEIDKLYDDHLDSLRLSGMEFDEDAVERARAEALADAYTTD